MLEEHRWGLAIPVSQIACEGPSKTHLAWGAWGGPVEKLLEHLHWFSPSAKGKATPSAFIILMIHRSTSNQESLQGLPKYKP
jgi:hypothetical protein